MRNLDLKHVGGVNATSAAMAVTNSTWQRSTNGKSPALPSQRLRLNIAVSNPMHQRGASDSEYPSVRGSSLLPRAFLAPSTLFRGEPALPSARKRHAFAGQLAILPLLFPSGNLYGAAYCVSHSQFRMASESGAQPRLSASRKRLLKSKRRVRKEPVLAAAGAVQFLEKLAPAIEGVDSPSGAIGTAVNRAIETLVTTSADARATYNGFAPIATAISSLSRTRVEKKVPQNQRNLRSSVFDVLPSSRMMECSRQRQSMRTPHPLTVQWSRPTASAWNYAGQRFRTR